MNVVALVFSFIFPIVIVFVTLALLYRAKKFEFGAIYYYPYFVIFSNSIAVLLSSRSYSRNGEVFESAVLANPVAALAIKIASFCIVFGSVDQIYRFVESRIKLTIDRFFLLLSFVAYWLSNVLIPAFFSRHEQSFEISWIYSLVLASGLILINPVDSWRLVRSFRNALSVFCLVSIALALLKPDLVLQANYSQGYIPGLPRFAGLAPHAILMGVLSSLLLFCQYVEPFKKKHIQKIVMIIASIALFMSQAKNVWIAFVLLMPVLVYLKWQSVQGIGRDKKIRIELPLLVIFFLIVPLFGAIAYIGGFATGLERLFDSEKSNQLLSLTGRDQIWAVAINEWSASPWFGYGLPLFGSEHRDAIRMFFATSGHNQIMDSLGRVGSVGTFFGLLHFFLLIYFGMKYRRATRGLSLVLIASIVIRMISEVPLTLLTVGMDTAPYYLLLTLIAKAMYSDDQRGCVNVNR